MKVITIEDAKEQGLKKYFTGSECKNGHVAEIYVNHKRCTTCEKEAQLRKAAKKAGILGFATEIAGEDTTSTKGDVIGSLNKAVQLTLAYAKLTSPSVFAKPSHPLYGVLTAKPKTGYLGELFFALYLGCGPRENSEHDCVSSTLGKVEIKTARAEGAKTLSWFNQIRFEKDWDTLAFVNITEDTIEAYTAPNVEEVKESLITNNSYSFNGLFQKVRDNPIFTEVIPLTKYT